MMGKILGPTIHMCAVCYKGNMNLDFDTDTVTCIECSAKFKVIHGALKNPGTDESYRPMFLGEQIKGE